MSFNDILGSRMKNNYENIPKTKLMRRTPVAIRLDGKAFHSFTRGFKKPFDEVLSASMRETMEYLCENIQGCVFGYTQSDEITLILVDYQAFETEAWFDYEVQKVCSISASMATMKFNQVFADKYFEARRKIDTTLFTNTYDNNKYIEVLAKAKEKGAMFDARCFNIPKEEVVNLIYWRQLDALRNSVQMVGQAYFSHKELQGKSCEEIKEMLRVNSETPDWENYPTYLQRGCAWTKNKGIDLEIPIFKGEWNRKYIQDLIDVGE